MKGVLFVLRSVLLLGGALGYLIFMVIMVIDKQRPRKLGLDEEYIKNRDVSRLLIRTVIGWAYATISACLLIIYSMQLVTVGVPGLVNALTFGIPELILDVVIMFFRIIVTVFNISSDSIIAIIIYSFIGFLNSVIPDLIVTALITTGMVKLTGFLISKYIWNGNEDFVILVIRVILILCLLYTIVTGYEVIGVDMNLENTSEIGVVVFTVLLIQFREVYRYFSKRLKIKARG